MTYGMYVSATGAQAQSERIQVLSNNLANADTPGFKRELAIFQALPTRAIATGEDDPASHSRNNVSGGVSLFETATDQQTGNFRHTGIPQDMAIQGEGYFVVARGDETLLTRSGNFRFSSNGTLENTSGYPVLATDGQPIQINPTLPWTLSRQGEINQAGGSIPLALVRPNSQGDLAKAGENLFRPLAETNNLPATERSVHSGYLEKSTVKPTLEMMELIEASRAYEANVRLIQHQDQMLGNLVNRVLRQS